MREKLRQQQRTIDRQREENEDLRRDVAMLLRKLDMTEIALRVERQMAADAARRGSWGNGVRR